MKFGKKELFASAVLLVVAGMMAFAGIDVSTMTYRRDTSQKGEISELDQDGNLELQGNLESRLKLRAGYGVFLSTSFTAPKVPTTTTSGNGRMGINVPFVNTSTNSMTAGAIVLASSGTVTNTLAAGIFESVTSTTSWVGINCATLASKATGYMTVAGYALVLTSGTVNTGDLVVSSNVVSGAGGGGSASTAGYGGRITGADAVLEGTVVGKAMSAGTASGGLTLIRIGN